MRYTTRLALANLPKTVATCSTSFATNSHFLTGEAPGATRVPGMRVCNTSYTTVDTAFSAPALESPVTTGGLDSI